MDYCQKLSLANGCHTQHVYGDNPDETFWNAAYFLPRCLHWMLKVTNQRIRNSFMKN